MAKNSAMSEAESEILEVVDSEGATYKVGRDKLEDLLGKAIIVEEIVCSLSCSRKAADYQNNTYFMSNKLSVGGAYQVLSRVGAFGSAEEFAKDPSGYLKSHKDYALVLGKTIAEKVDKCFGAIRAKIATQMKQDGIPIFSWGSNP